MPFFDRFKPKESREAREVRLSGAASVPATVLFINLGLKNPDYAWCAAHIKTIEDLVTAGPLMDPEIPDWYNAGNDNAKVARFATFLSFRIADMWSRTAGVDAATIDKMSEYRDYFFPLDDDLVKHALGLLLHLEHEQPPDLLMRMPLERAKAVDYLFEIPPSGDQTAQFRKSFAFKESTPLIMFKELHERYLATGPS